MSTCSSPTSTPITVDAYDEYARTLLPTADRLHRAWSPAALREDDDDWGAKIARLTSDPVPVVSFTFGLPPTTVLDDLRQAGSVLIQTVTTPEEARKAEGAGVDVLVVQGFAAGGHSGIWDADALPADVSLPELVTMVAAAVSLPTVAAGGIATAADVDSARAAGASAVGVGTAVLRAHESGASSLYKDALGNPRYNSTTLTRAFTGRPARALVNQFVLDHDGASPSGYPALHHLTRPLRESALAAGDASAINLWAGQQWQTARAAPLATILEGLLSTSSANN